MGTPIVLLNFSSLPNNINFYLMLKSDIVLMKSKHYLKLYGKTKIWGNLSTNNNSTPINLMSINKSMNLEFISKPKHQCQSSK